MNESMKACKKERKKERTKERKNDAVEGNVKSVKGHVPIPHESRSTIHDRFKRNGLYPAKRGLKSSHKLWRPPQTATDVLMSNITYLTSLTYHTIPYLYSLALPNSFRIVRVTRYRARWVVARARQEAQQQAAKRERHTCMA